MKKADLIKIGEKAESNHIWLNAFECINPSLEFAQKLGLTILKQLDERERLVKHPITKINDILYLSINKS